MGEEEAKKIESQLFRDLSYEITDPELERIKRELKLEIYGGFGAGQIQREFKSADDIFDKLKRKGVIRLGNYTKLRRLFEDLGFQHLCSIVQKKENELRAMHWPVESDSAKPDSGFRGFQPAPSMQVPGGFPGTPMYGQGGYAQPQMAHYHGAGFSPVPHHQQPYMTPQVPQSSYGQPESSVFSSSMADYGRGGPRQQTVFSQPEKKMATSMADAPHGGQLSSSGSFDLPENVSFDHRIYYEPGRGYVLFINNLFVGRTDHRRGAEKDEEHIRDLFPKQLDFYLQYEKDVTKNQLEKYLKAMRETLGSGRYKSFIMIIGSHGKPKADIEKKMKKDCVLMADDEWMQVDDIISCFHGDSIPAMKDKPKVFIIQSCRGRGLQKSVSLSDAPAEVYSIPVPIQEPPPSILSRPVNSDVLVAYATTEGTKAWRNEDEGSWFVKDLYDTIKEYYAKEHILDILVRVNDRMVWRESTEERAKQMPCFVCTFTKRFMFKPPAN